MDLLRNKTSKALISMSLPISIGMLSTFLFQVIDTYFIGQLGPNALAALGFASTVYFLLVGLFIGLSVGVSIIIGQASGAGDRAKVRSVTGLSLLIGFLLAVTLAFLGIIGLGPIFRGMGASEEILPLIEAYMFPLLLGIPLLTTGILSGGILRATGRVAPPEILMAIAGLFNLFFDYALIFGHWGFPEMGIRGAALATVLSWVLIFVGMQLLLLRDRLWSLQWVREKGLSAMMGEILSLSAPTVLTQIIGPFTLMYLTFLLAHQSPLAVAAFGVAGRIETLLMIGVLGVSTAITPFIAQNSGAQQDRRIDEAIAFGGKASTYLGLIVALLLFAFIQPIASWFSNDSQVIAYTTQYFYLVSLTYTFHGLYLITTSIFNGLKLPLNSLKISLIKAFLLTLPLTWLGSHWGIKGIFVALALSNILAGLYAAVQMRRSIRNSKSSLVGVSILQDYLKDWKNIFFR